MLQFLPLQIVTMGATATTIVLAVALQLVAAQGEWAIGTFRQIQ